MAIIIKSEAEIDLIEKAARAAVEIQQAIRGRISPGVSTAELEEMVTAALEQRHAISALLGYQGFPGTANFDVNHHVTNTGPGQIRLWEGDIVGVTVAVNLNGWCSKKHVTYPVGAVSNESGRLIAAAEEALGAAIDRCRPGIGIGAMSQAIQQCVEAKGFAVIREYGGHGIGRALHEDPFVPNYGSPSTGPELRPGMVLCIIPMITAGDWRTRRLGDWDVVTADGSLSAHVSDMVAITAGAPRVLTQAA